MTDLILAFGIYGLGIAISMLVALMIKGIVALLALRSDLLSAICLKQRHRWVSI